MFDKVEIKYDRNYRKRIYVDGKMVICDGNCNKCECLKDKFGKCGLKEILFEGFNQWLN